MDLVPPNILDRRRVKVYELKSNDWYDRGTGFCAGRVVNDEALIYVQSEEDPVRTLLKTRIGKEDGYQKQQDTLIVWTEPTGLDMALSFQESDGCSAIWEFVSDVQQKIGAMVGPAEDALSDETIEHFNPLMMPNPELGNLHTIENMIRSASSSPANRDLLSKYVINEDYILKLTPLVEAAENQENVQELHRLCNIMKTLILLNDSNIIEHVVKGHVILGVVGALEYDPDFPSHKANHRQYLADESKFKEVVTIENPEIRERIHYTYRLQYLRDVVLARILDDPTFSVLNSLIFYNQVEIIQHVQNNSDFLQELFSVLTSRETSALRKREAVLWIQQCCSIVKALPASNRDKLYQAFISHDIFQVITYALRHQDASIRVAGADIITALIDHDPALLRDHIMDPMRPKVSGSQIIPPNFRSPLEAIIEFLITESDLGIRTQLAESIKTILDPTANTPVLESMGRMNHEILAKMRSANQENQKTKELARAFYQGPLVRKLFQPLMDLEKRVSLNTLTPHEASLYSSLIEILSNFHLRHTPDVIIFAVTEQLSSRIAQLLCCPEKHLKLVVVKYFRICLGLENEQYTREMIQKHIFEPILDIVCETMPRDNLLNSACLELFEYIRHNNLKAVITHVVENYRDKIQNITCVDVFANLILRYEQLQGYRPDLEMSFTSNDEDTSLNRSQSTSNGVQRGAWQGLKDTDAEEEAYFNGSDNEEDELALEPQRKFSLNGTTSPVRPLVDYPDDDEDAMDTSPDAPATAVPHDVIDGTAGEHSRAAKSAVPAALAAPATQTPPESIAEKRKREASEDEDELGKLSTQPLKRRGSSSSNSSVGSARREALTGRKSANFNAGKDGGKRIAISLAVKGPSENDAPKSPETEEVQL